MANESPNIGTNLSDAVKASADVFAALNIKYALIGGVAISHLSQPRFTKDVDFLLSVSQLSMPPLLEKLQERGFEFDLLPTIREWTDHHMVVLSYRGVRVDWLKPILPIYSHVLDRAEAADWFGHSIRIASTEGLILLKLLANRLQDQIDVENLVAAHRGKLDLDWIREEWLELAPLDDPRMVRLLELATKNAG